jgi:CheY-like chemotaxis protein
MSVHLDNVNILLVDDSPDNRELIRRMLSKAGATVVDAEGAADARKKLETFKPDIIVSDIGMPEENGMEFIKKLRTQGREDIRKIPAIALTAYVREEEKESAISAGFQAHIGKPVSAPMLLEAIRNLTQI